VAITPPNGGFSAKNLGYLCCGGSPEREHFVLINIEGCGPLLRRPPLILGKRLPPEVLLKKSASG